MSLAHRTKPERDELVFEVAAKWAVPGELLYRPPVQTRTLSRLLVEGWNQENRLRIRTELARLGQDHPARFEREDSHARRVRQGVVLRLTELLEDIEGGLACRATQQGVEAAVEFGRLLGNWETGLSMREGMVHALQVHAARPRKGESPQWAAVRGAFEAGITDHKELWFVFTEAGGSDRDQDVFFINLNRAKKRWAKAKSG
jgi:hypothetical protein